MPLMSKEDHEALLTKLLAGDIEQSEKTQILHDLRVDYNNAHTDFQSLESTNQKYVKDNDDLIKANSMLFRQAGVVGNSEKEEEIEQQTFSETVTVSQLERGFN